MPAREPGTPVAPASSTAAEFAEGVGRAVLAWHDVEVSCARLYVALLDARNAEGALGSFQAVHSHVVRVSMLKTAARYMFKSPDFEDLSTDFDAVMDQLAEASRLRNRMTHSEAGEEMTDTGWAFTLQAPPVDTGAAGSVRAGQARGKSQSLDFAAVRAAEGQIRSLAQGLRAFEEQLRERLDGL